MKHPVIRMKFFFSILAPVERPKNWANKLKFARFLIFLAARISLLSFYLVFKMFTDSGLLKIHHTSLVSPRCGFAIISVIDDNRSLNELRFIGSILNHSNKVGLWSYYFVHCPFCDYSL